MSDYVEAHSGRVMPGLRSWLRAGTRVVRDPLRWSRFRWLACSWIWAVGTLLMGGALLVAGPAILVAEGPFVIYAKVLGDQGIRLDGLVLVLLGLTLVIGLSQPLFGHAEPRQLLLRTHKALGYYYLWCVTLFALAPLAPGGSFSYLAVVIWTMLGSIPIVLSFAPPPHLVPRVETELLRALIEEDVPVGVAARIAGRIYGGPHEEH